MFHVDIGMGNPRYMLVQVAHLETVHSPALPCPALPCPALPCPALPCPALPCPALPCPALPCPALPCPALPCPALPYIVPEGCVVYPLSQLGNNKLTLAGFLLVFHSASMVLIISQHPALMGKLFGPLKERYATRPGGYTRVLRAPKRQGDNAQMAVVEFVDNG